MAKLKLGQLIHLKEDYKVYYGESHRILRNTLKTLNVIDQVEKEVILENAGKIEKEALEKIEILIKKSLKQFRVSLMDDYLFNSEFHPNLDDEEKRNLKSNIETLESYFKKRKGVGIEKYLKLLEENNYYDLQ